MKKQDLIDEIINIVKDVTEGLNEDLLDYKLDKLLTYKVINFTSSSLPLKEKETITFQKWLKVNNYKKKNDILYSKGISLIHKNILYKFYEIEQNL